MNKTQNHRKNKPIKSFWNWFQKNEIEIFKALLIFENYDNTLDQFKSRVENISNKIGFIIKAADKSKTKFKIIFTAHGNPKLFNLVNQITEQAPALPNWETQAFVQPSVKIEKFTKGFEEEFIFQDFSLKGNEVNFPGIDFNDTKKKVNIIIYIKSYNYHFDNQFLEEAIYIISQDVAGEKAAKNNITLVQLAQKPNQPQNLIKLYELQTYIDLFNLGKR
jgi:hypothetical protein